MEQELVPKIAKAVLLLSWREQRAHHQGLPRHKGNSREDKEQSKPIVPATTTHKRGKSYLHRTPSAAILPNIPTP
jgi:hypothetical protein